MGLGLVTGCLAVVALVGVAPAAAQDDARQNSEFGAPAPQPEKQPEKSKAAQEKEEEHKPTDPDTGKSTLSHDTLGLLPNPFEDKGVKLSASYIAWRERWGHLPQIGVPAGPILNTQQAFENEQVQTMPAWRPVTHPILGELKLTGHGVNLERTPPSIRSAAPERGQHTDEILKELEYSPEEIAKLHETGAV